MKIVFFDDRFDQVYGAQENVLLLADVCRRAGHDPLFVTTAEGVLADEARRRGLETEVVDAPASLRQFEGTSLDGGVMVAPRLALDLLRYNKTISRALRSHAPDVIFCSAVRPFLLLFGMRLVGRAPLILYAQNSIPRGVLAVAAGLASRRICLIGDGARSTFPARFVERFSSRFTELPSGRDVSKLASTGQREQRSTTEDIEVVTVSSVTERKGIHVLIEALALANERGVNARLTVVGGTTGPVSEAYRDRLIDQAEQLQVAVDFVGWHDDVLPFLDAADVFAMASEHEGLPGVLIEAMANGLPCATTRAGSAGELVEAAGAGHAVAVGDTDGLADALAALCVDRDRRLALGHSGCQYMQDHFSLESFQRRFEEVLVDVVEGK